MKETYYKLRDRKTGLFREGGMWGKWSKEGKRWDGIGHLKNHLGQYKADKIDWDNWEVVEYEYRPVEVGARILEEFR